MHVAAYSPDDNSSALKPRRNNSIEKSAHITVDMIYGFVPIRIYDFVVQNIVMCCDGGRVKKKKKEEKKTIIMTMILMFYI